MRDVYLSYDDEAEQAALAWQRAWQARSRYRTEVVPQAGGAWYWHLFHDDVRVNGGLSPTRVDAFADAGFAIRRHLFDTPETAR